MNPRIVWAIFRKDILDAIRNTYIFVALLLPVGMSLLFSVMLPSQNFSNPVFKVAVYDPGHSQILEKLRAAAGVDITLVDSAEQAKARAADGSSIGLVLPSDLDASIAAGEKRDIQLFYDSGRTVVTQITVNRLLEGFLRELAGQQLPARITTVDIAPPAANAAPAFDVAHYMLVLLIVMGTVMTGVFVVPTILVEEKEKQTLQAVLVSPASYADIVIGKSLVGMVYALLSAFILLALNGGFAGAPAVSVATVFLGSLFLVLTGLLLGAIFKTTAQVNTWSSIIMLALLFPAMFVMIQAPPEPIPTLLRIIPTSHISTALNAALSGTVSFAGAGVDLLILAGCAAVVFGAVLWVLRQERR
jgi:ABC-2 type transport system permease protein